ncbi:monocarboxylate transporter 6 isoform X2 [Onychomys torridus]|uniref:monocarboxylate transporter 6 isoform X2 n=1 Tax=Onychomys torridus TaxID=38674 RepID=UPI00167F6367|nr:monocarboxylate transporter 6 isoform X2 [Onychomys torridus]
MSQALEQADGRWAWAVLLASLVNQALTLGFPSCIGVFFTDLQRDFQATNSETSWFPSLMGAMIHGGGLLLDITNNFSYIFSASSFLLISASIFIGVGFYAAEKQQLKQKGPAKVEDTISEITPMQGLTSEDKDGAKKQLCPENMYVTTV